MQIDIRTICGRYGIEPRGVIHLGAHEGQELDEYRRLGATPMLFVEANPAVFARLAERIKTQGDVYAAQCAVGNADGVVKLNVTSNDQSSSILPLKYHSLIYPQIVQTHQLEVPMRRLDTLMAEAGLRPSDFNIMHLDLQGAELLALKGAEGTLTQIEMIRTEVNLMELYEGCPLIADLDVFLSARGFERVAAQTPYHPSWGDAVYVRRRGVISMSTLGQIGRFGNQLLQYAFLRIYAKEHDLVALTPAWIGRQLFGLDDPPIACELPTVRDEAHRMEESVVLNSPPLKNVDLWGFFQFHTSFYRKQKELFCSLYEPVAPVRSKVEQALERLRERGRTIVGLHIRRGDYHDPKGAFHLIASEDLYKQHVRQIFQTHPSPILFLASDEIDVVKEQFAEFNPVTAEDLGVQIPEAPYYPDFYLLCNCDALLVSNSSFSIVAAMLNQRAKLFVRPTFEGTMVAYDPWDAPLLLEPPPQELAARKASYADRTLPVLFVTPLLNGLPFIKHHITQFRGLPFWWMWHIVEGVVMPPQSAGCAPVQAAAVSHRNGLSSDGTSEYLDHLVTNHGFVVNIYRKGGGEFWSSTREMLETVTSRVAEECLLWLIYPDELWTAQQIIAARRMFLENPQKTAAAYRRRAGAGAVGRGGDAPDDDPGRWVRTWRFRPGMSWSDDQPPLLAEKIGQNEWRSVVEVDRFDQGQTEAAGLTFLKGS